MSNDTKDDKARDRTDWAEDRTIMANERTFASWIGTGLGAVGIAIGLKAVFGATDPTWVAKLVASMFLGIGIMLFWSAQQRACKTLGRLSQHDTSAQSTKGFTRLATAMTIVTVATGAVLWSL